MTHAKVKLTTGPPSKLASEHTHLLKTKRANDNYQPVITFAFLGAKGQSSHYKEKHHSTMKDFGDKSLYSVVDVNSRIGSPTGMSKRDNSSDQSNFVTSSFLVTMPVMVIGTTSVEQQLAEMSSLNSPRLLRRKIYK